VVEGGLTLAAASSQRRAINPALVGVKAARVDVEGSQVIFKVNVEPLAACCTSFGHRDGNVRTRQVAGRALALRAETRDASKT
jgi:hypothetical protein